MRNLEQLKVKELSSINGGTTTPSVYDDGNGGCTPDPLKDILSPTTGPTFPDPFLG